MQAYTMENIGRIGIFIICAQVLIHLRPNASYEKYFKMLVSAMILIQLLMPICGLLGMGEAQDLMQRVEWFEGELSRQLDEAGHAWQTYAGETAEPQVQAQEPTVPDIAIEPIEGQAIKIEIDSGEGEDNAENRRAGTTKE